MRLAAVAALVVAGGILLPGLASAAPRDSFSLVWAVHASDGNDVKLWRDDQTRELHGELIGPARGGIELYDGGTQRIARASRPGGGDTNTNGGAYGHWAACEFLGMPEQISICTLLAP
ncbi:hypothetical protein VSH64_11210 [Amycolatopsis rhabdoformis]|uniref:Uncharacterized protein n=1 Tax=Amycolatopsis rhabdoformis TaxID=1448059 RepID=A0ABZ1IDX6_9PSEU|nr:hypothetical protein [Amycolatopsis rhabdoformis]WSE32671.1 hypothetical protein VSH64_11210 [Amycolatopsis rhabdoformis]